VGGLTKADVRAHARALGLRVAEKPDSQEICFVPDGDYASFVERQAPAAVKAGAVADESGRTLATHEGVHRFTVGQRKGLGVASQIPLYVLRIDADSGEVTVGPRAALERRALTASQVNWTAGDVPSEWRAVTAQIRHRHRPAAGRVRALPDGRAEFESDEPLSRVNDCNGYTPPWADPLTLARQGYRFVPAVAEAPEGWYRDPLRWRHRLRDGAIVLVEVNSRPMTFNGRSAMLVAIRHLDPITLTTPRE